MFIDPDTGEISMNVNADNLIVELREALHTILENFSEEDRNNMDLLTTRYAELVIRRLNGEDVDVKLGAVKAALLNYKVGATSNASNVARQLAMDFFTSLIVKIL